MGKRIIIAGGGTGGHIFPAIAIANALHKIDNSVVIHFVGARGKMEMEKVPQAGYTISGIDIAGFDRGQWWRNVSLPFKLIKSFWQVRSLFRSFKPDAAFGVGGYSSFPVLRFAQSKGIPTYLHEANAFGGKSNILLGKRARIIFAGTRGMERFFPAEKILFTGNPVRQDVVEVKRSREEALKFFGLYPDRLTLLVIGGSLGARTINLAVRQGVQRWVSEGYQLIWQTGKLFTADSVKVTTGMDGVYVNDFIQDMNAAYTAADLVISRAGAMSVTELCLMGKAVIFVPFPFAAEDHQTANAMELVRNNAARMVKDNEAAGQLMDMALELAKNESLRKEMSENIKPMAKADADMVIASSILNDLDKR
jgi:UDP-N-acetylglucosamine--N-acetylmuramyl-(pentapeptide) pyrophosphoryl-undecaprenol N-acetylglucosamine transferase